MHLIVDGNNIAWAGLYALGHSIGLETKERRVRAGTVGLTQSVMGLVARGAEPPGNSTGRGGLTGLTIVFDEGRPLRRRQIYPAYQTGREATSSFMDNQPSVREAIDIFTRGCTFLPCTVLRGTNTEADDLAAAAALADKRMVRIVSSDRDFLQLVNGRISIYSPIKRIVVSEGNFVDSCCPRASDGSLVPFPRERYLDFRAASGDSSDDLPGIPGVGAITAARLLSKNALDAYLDDPGLAPRVLERRNVKLEGAVRSGEARSIIERNRSLMDLRLAASFFGDLDPYGREGSWHEDHRIEMNDARAVITGFERIAQAGSEKPG